MFGTALSMWTYIQVLSAKYSNLLRKTKLQNAYSPHIPHSGGKKIISSLAELNWVFTSFHGHKGLILRTLESPMSAVVGPPGTVSFPPQHTQRTDCSFMKWKCPRKRKCEGVLSHSFQRGERRIGYCIWILRMKPETQVIGYYYGSLAFLKAKSGTAFTCLSSTDPCISLCRDVRESV